MIYQQKTKLRKYWVAFLYLLLRRSDHFSHCTINFLTLLFKGVSTEGRSPGISSSRSLGYRRGTHFGSRSNDDDGNSSPSIALTPSSSHGAQPLSRVVLRQRFDRQQSFLESAWVNREGCQGQVGGLTHLISGLAVHSHLHLYKVGRRKVQVLPF